MAVLPLIGAGLALAGGLLGGSRRRRRARREQQRAEAARRQALTEFAPFLDPTLQGLGLQQVEPTDFESVVSQPDFIKRSFEKAAELGIDPTTDAGKKRVFDALVAEGDPSVFGGQQVEITPFGAVASTGQDVGQQFGQQIFDPAAAQIGVGTAGAVRRAEREALAAGRDPAAAAALARISGANQLGQARQQAGIAGTQLGLQQTQQSFQNLSSILSGNPIPVQASTPGFLETLGNTAQFLGGVGLSGGFSGVPAIPGTGRNQTSGVSQSKTKTQPQSQPFSNFTGSIAPQPFSNFLFSGRNDLSLFGGP